MKNKKGFTLIELIVVIIILGVLVLISVPTINSIITKAKKSSFIVETKEFLSLAEKKRAEDIKGNLGAKTYNIQDLDEKTKYTGTVTIDENENYFITIQNPENGYTITNKTKNDLETESADDLIEIVIIEAPNYYAYKNWTANYPTRISIDKENGSATISLTLNFYIDSDVEPEKTFTYSFENNKADSCTNRTYLREYNSSNTESMTMFNTTKISKKLKSDTIKIRLSHNPSKSCTNYPFTISNPTVTIN